MRIDRIAALFAGMVAAAAATLVLPPAIAPAAAQQVLLAPGTVVFEGRTRSAEIMVANTTDRRARYRVEPVLFSMDEGGMLNEVAALPGRSAAGMIRFSPRQFELRPGEKQTIRLALRKPENLRPGEYRLHLRVVNTDSAGASPLGPSIASVGGTGARIDLRVARAVRVLVRHRVEAGAAELAEVSARRVGSDVSVAFALRRSGDGSASGSFEVVAPGVAQPLLSGPASVYAELTSRRFEGRVAASEIGGSDTVCIRYRDDRTTATGERCTGISGR